MFIYMIDILYRICIHAYICIIYIYVLSSPLNLGAIATASDLRPCHGAGHACPAEPFGTTLRLQWPSWDVRPWASFGSSTWKFA